MRLYLTESEVPELEPLPPAVRRLVVEQALAMLCEEARIFGWLPSLLCFPGGLIGGLVGEALLVCAVSLGYVQQLSTPSGDWLMANMILWCGGVTAGAALAGFLGLHFQRAKLRPFLRKVIAEREKKAQRT